MMPVSLGRYNLWENMMAFQDPLLMQKAPLNKGAAERYIRPVTIKIHRVRLLMTCSLNSHERLSRLKPGIRETSVCSVQKVSKMINQQH